MKIIISHDVDHLGVREHWLKDLIIQKYIIWSLLELYRNKISLNTFLKKIIGLFKKNAWNNLEKLLQFDKENEVKPTFFIAVNNGKGLNYSLKQARIAFDLIKKYDFDIGCHGICFNDNDYEGIKKEFEIFKKLTGLKNFGVRMHYLRLDKDTLKNLAKVGYLFDTTVLSDKLDQEYRINDMIEIPFHLMEGILLGPKSKYKLDEVKQKTLDLLNEAIKKNVKYFGVLFHQEYFNDEFPQYKNWYIWLIDYCKNKGFQFINYKDLIK